MRMTQRTREFAIRAALGAQRRDLLAYSLAESALLALIGTIGGVVVSLWITGGVTRWLLPNFQDWTKRPSTQECWFSAQACVLIHPSFRSGACVASIDSRSARIHQFGGRGNTESRRTSRFRLALVGMEVALGTVLAIGAGLLLASLHRVMNVPRGFSADRVLIADFNLPSPKYQTANAIDRFYTGLRDQLAIQPGVLRVAAATFLPLDNERFSPVVAEHPRAGESGDLVTWTAVTPDYFEAMEIPLREGRFFRKGETDDVAIVNESAARILWPGETAIGRRLSREGPWEPVRTWLRVVGVAGDVLSAGLDPAHFTGSLPAVLPLRFAVVPTGG